MHDPRFPACFKDRCPRTFEHILHFPLRCALSHALYNMAKEILSVAVSEEESTLEVAQKWRGSEVDRHDMLVIGRPQQLRRNFQLATILSFGCILISTWELNTTYSDILSNAAIMFTDCGF